MKRSARRSVITRVLFSYVFITLCFAGVAWYSVLGQRRSVRETELMSSAYMPLAGLLRDAVAMQNTYNTQLNHVTEASNPGDKQVWFESALRLARPKLFADIRVALGRAFEKEASTIGASLATEVYGIERFLEQDAELIAQLFAALKHHEEERSEELRDELVTRGSQAADMFGLLEGRVSQQVEFLIAEASERERWTLRVVLAWAAFTLLVGIGVGLYARRVLRPLVSVTRRAQAVAQGDFTPREAVASDDEFGELARAFETMVAAIARANQELLASERLATIGKMAAQVTHEVRNPLSSIALNLELLEEELCELMTKLDTQGEVGSGAEAMSLSMAMKKEVGRLTDLTEQYLSLARRGEPHFQSEDLSAVLQEAVNFVSPDLRRRGVQLEFRAEGDDFTCVVDEAQIRQVANNLIRNARQATGEGGRVEVLLRARQWGVELLVCDDGPGVPEEVRTKLFEPFFSTRSHGTGLGLAISQHIVELHGGSVTCSENRPHGSVFTVAIPRIRPQEALH